MVTVIKPAYECRLFSIDNTSKTKFKKKKKKIPKLLREHVYIGVHRTQHPYVFLLVRYSASSKLEFLNLYINKYIGSMLA